MRKVILPFILLCGFISAQLVAQTQVATLQQLNDALADPSVTEIQLAADIAGVIDDNAPMIERNGFVLDGNGHTISGTVTGYLTNGQVSANPNILSVVNSNGVIVRNLTLTNAGSRDGRAARNGMTVWHSSNVELQNVILRGNGGGGLQVNGSTVTATGLLTEGNTWYGVGVSVGSDPGTITPHFTFDNTSVFNDTYAIVPESADQLTVPADGTWGTISLPSGAVLATNKATRDSDGLLLNAATLEELSTFLSSTASSFDGVLLDAGNYELAATLAVDRDVIIKGSGIDQTILSAPSSVGFLVRMNAGTFKSLSLQGYAADNDGPNQNQSGIQTSTGTVVIDSVKIENFRSGISTDTSPTEPHYLTINNSQIEGNRTGLILTCKGSILDATITNNTIINNRTFGILLNSTDADWNGATMTLTGNIIHDNWFAEFETRVDKPFDLSANYWGPAGPIIYPTFANETPSPVDGGDRLTTKPDHYTDGEIYQPVNATREANDLIDFTAGKLTIDNYYADQTMSKLTVRPKQNEANEGVWEEVHNTNGLAQAIASGAEEIHLIPSPEQDVIELNQPLTVTSPLLIKGPENGDPVNISVPSGTTVFTTQGASTTLNLEKVAINIVGEPQAAPAPVINVAADTEVTVTNSTFSGTIGDTPLITVAGALTIEDTHIRDINTLVLRSVPVSTRVGENTSLVDATAGEVDINRSSFTNIQSIGYFISGENVEIYNSLFHNNGNMSLIDISTAPSVINITNITYVNNTAQNAAPIINYTEGQATIKNNILYTAAPETIVITGETTGLDADYNALRTANPTANSIALNTLEQIGFGSATDYRLSPSSPLIGRGDPNAVQGNLDLAGVARTTNSRVNPGAYEQLYDESGNNPGPPPGPNPEQPSDPGNLVLQQRTDNSAVIGWSDVVNATEYEVELYQTSSQTNPVLIRTIRFSRSEVLSSNGTRFEIDLLDPEMTYRIDIKALNTQGQTIATRSINIPLADDPTGIDSILDETKVYSEVNNIRIETTNPIQVTIIGMTGNTFFKGKVTGSHSVSVPQGIYIVYLSGEKGNTTLKIRVN